MLIVLLCILALGFGLLCRAVSGLYRQLLESERALADQRQIAAVFLAAEAELKRQAEHWRKAAERTKRLYFGVYAELGLLRDSLKEKPRVD